GLILQIIVVSLLIQCFSLLSPLFTQIILDRVVVQKSLSTLNVFVAGLFIFGIWGLVMGGVRQYLLSYFSNRLDLTLISGFIRHTMALPMRFFESRRVGDIITRVQENQKIQQFLIGQVVLAWLGFVTGFVYLGLMLYYNLQLTLLVLLMVPPIIIITLGATPFLRRISREIFKEAADQNSALVEMIGGIATIKSTATEHELRWRWENNLTRLLNARFRGQKFGIGLQSVSGFINSIGNTVLLWYGARLVILDQLTIGQFVAFNMMIGYVISPVISLANLWDELQEIYISIERLNDVFEAKPEEANGKNMMVMPPVEGIIAFESVTFRYSEESDRNTLQNISFEVPAGSTVAIVGRSGSGKSTLIKLLEGLYQPKQGRVLIDGHDIRHVVPSSLRSQLGVVPQDCVLFSGSILENISLFRDNVPLESVVKAAKLAEAHSFIQALPLGYSTTVGERGATLSGGQRQRIAIARALLKQPRILLLDEATSSLDTESERHFQQNLERISSEVTAVIIAHRLSTVRNADCILVLDRGILVEQGTHTELMAQKGLYHSLAEQQLDL
ncbi:MAG: peptidase domain-containing ABC transporter, partial [Cyanobacteria bacterium J06650_10]